MNPVIRRSNPGWTQGLMQRFKAAAGKEIAVGFPKGTAQSYPDGQTTTEVAAIQCFGMGVPQRDFMTYGAELMKTDQTIKQCLKLAATDSNVRVVETMREAAGQQAASLVKQAILEGEWTPNHPQTIRQKGSSKPLIDTSAMKNAVTYVVRDKK